MARIPLYERAPLLQTGTQVLRPAQFAVEPRSAIGEGLMDIGRAVGSFAIKMQQDKKNLENMNTLSDLDNTANQYQLELMKWQTENTNDSDLDQYEPRVQEYTQKLRDQYSNVTDPELRSRINTFINRWDGNLRTEAYASSINQLSKNFDQKWNQGILSLQNTGDDVGLVQALEYGRQKGILNNDQYLYKSEQLNGARRTYSLNQSNALIGSYMNQGNWEAAKAAVQEDVESGLRTENEAKAKLTEIDARYIGAENKQYWEIESEENPAGVLEEFKNLSTPTDSQGQPVVSTPAPLPKGSKVTHYGQATDPLSDSNSAKGVGAFGIGEGKGPANLQGGNYLLKDYSMAVSPDVEQQMKAKGIKPGDWVSVQLANGKTVTKRWDDRTSDQLTGRVDFYTPVGDAPDLDVNVGSIAKVAGPPPGYVQPPRYIKGVPQAGASGEIVAVQPANEKLRGLSKNDIRIIQSNALKNATVMGNKQYVDLKNRLDAGEFSTKPFELEAELDKAEYLTPAQANMLRMEVDKQQLAKAINSPEVIDRSIQRINEYRDLKAANPAFDPDDKIYLQLLDETSTYLDGDVETAIQESLRQVHANAEGRTVYQKTKSARDLLRSSVLYMKEPVTVDIAGGWFTDPQQGVMAMKKKEVIVNGKKVTMYEPDLKEIDEAEKQTRFEIYDRLMKAVEQKVRENPSVTEAELQSIIVNDASYIQYATVADRVKKYYKKGEKPEMTPTVPATEQTPGAPDVSDETLKKAQEAANRYK